MTDLPPAAFAARPRGCILRSCNGRRPRQSATGEVRLRSAIRAVAADRAPRPPREIPCLASVPDPLAASLPPHRSASETTTIDDKVMSAAVAERQATLHRVQAEIGACRRCVEGGTIPAARPIFRGHAGQRWMVVGQAPGPGTSDAGIPYAGATGKTLGRWLERAGFPPGALHEQFYLTSLTKCFPGKARDPRGKGDRAPSAVEIGWCRPHLDREIALVQPAIIVSLGRLAANALAPETRGLPLAEIVGQVWSGERGGHAFVLVPLPHPSGVSHWLNAPANRARVEIALTRLGEMTQRIDMSSG